MAYACSHFISMSLGLSYETAEEASNKDLTPMAVRTAERLPMSPCHSCRNHCRMLSKDILANSLEDLYVFNVQDKLIGLLY